MKESENANRTGKIPDLLPALFCKINFYEHQFRKENEGFFFKMCNFRLLACSKFNCHKDKCIYACKLWHPYSSGIVCQEVGVVQHSNNNNTLF